MGNGQTSGKRQHTYRYQYQVERPTGHLVTDTNAQQVRLGGRALRIVITALFASVDLLTWHEGQQSRNQIRRDKIIKSAKVIYNVAE
jgi:hypothetical protein